MNLPGLTISYGLGDRVEQLVGKFSEALIQAQDLRDRVVQLERELVTSRAAHEVTALERDRATTELAMMRAWVEQARPVVEAVREIQHEVAAGSADAVGSLEADLEIMPLPPKEPK